MKRILFALAIAFQPVGVAGQDDVPSFVTVGFDLLISSGPEQAIDHWGASWTAEADLLKKAQLKNGFMELWDGLGHATGYEVVATKWTGTRLVDVYAVTFHAGQPLFFFITAYDAPAGWMSTWVNAHTSAGEIFPDWVLSGRG